MLSVDGGSDHVREFFHVVTEWQFENETISECDKTGRAKYADNLFCTLHGSIFAEGQYPLFSESCRDFLQWIKDNYLDRCLSGGRFCDKESSWCKKNSDLKVLGVEDEETH